LPAHFSQLFGIDVVPATGIDAPKWHEDVQVWPQQNNCILFASAAYLNLSQFWQINRDGAPVAYFYLDPYSRPHEKRQVVLRSALIFEFLPILFVHPPSRVLGWIPS
jgi:Zn-dependent oligopeptidase